MAGESELGCALLELPVEILHNIFDFLDKKAALLARQTCVTLGVVGSEHVLHELAAVYKRDRLQRLVDISQHATISKTIRSVYWQSDRLLEPAMSYEKWNKVRAVARPWAEYNIYHEIPLLNDNTLDPTSARAQRAFKRAHKLYDRNMKGHFSKAELELAYESYKALVQDQKDITDNNFDLDSFTTFFKGCPKVDNVTVATAYGTGGFKDAARMAFKEAMISPYGDCNILDSGVHQFWTILRALHLAQRTPKCFTATDVSYRIFQESRAGYQTQPIITHLMGNLREFRLGLSIHEDELDPAREGEGIDIGSDCRRYYSPGLLAQWLSGAPQLRVLKLRMYHNHFVDVMPEARLKEVVGSTKWPKLREIGLNDILTTEDELLDFLLRHKDSLRRLSLSYIYLQEGSWTSFLERIGGKLPKLKKIKLRGDLSDLEWGTYEFAVPGCGDDYDEPFQQAAEKFFMYGGDLEDFLSPEFEQQMIDSDMPPDANSNRIDDEDAGYTTDGSAISYGSDGFDSTI